MLKLSQGQILVQLRCFQTKVPLMKFSGFRSQSGSKLCLWKASISKSQFQALGFPLEDRNLVYTPCSHLRNQASMCNRSNRKYCTLAYIGWAVVHHSKTRGQGNSHLGILRHMRLFDILKSQLNISWDTLSDNICTLYPSRYDSLGRLLTKSFGWV
jgi:hypothetical protein